jgi:Domain of unknown function (DUF4345)
MFITALRVLGIGCILAGLLHVIFGLSADTMLGAQAIAFDATRDSQNRFYGAAFTVYGVLLLMCGTDLRRYASILRIVLAFFFLAGLARLISIVAVGMPSIPALLLLATELIGPPVLWVWQGRASHDIR